MSSVAIDPRIAAPPDTREHIGHHRTKGATGHRLLRIDGWKTRPAPGDERIDPLSAYVAIVAVILRGTGNTKARRAQMTRDDFCGVVPKADPRAAF